MREADVWAILVPGIESRALIHDTVSVTGGWALAG
jgi:hypothetical protein